MTDEKTTIKRMCELAQVNDIGDVSDGFHTFNQLYHQRAVLFATIVNQNKDKAWKSFKHEDGQYCFDSNGEWFIVGVDTPEGSYTYHYEKKYWDMFKCEELPCGKHWDGHTEEDVTRLLSLVKGNNMHIDTAWLVVLAISFFNIGFFTRGIVNGSERAEEAKQSKEQLNDRSNTN